MQVSSQSTVTMPPFYRLMRVVYPAPAMRSGLGPCMQYLRRHWQKIAIALIGGVLAGFFAGAVSSRDYVELSPVVYAAGVTSNGNRPAAQDPAAQADSKEISRLRAENQQLQALVDELQKELEATHGRRATAHHRRRSGAHAS